MANDWHPSIGDQKNADTFIVSALLVVTRVVVPHFRQKDLRLRVLAEKSNCEEETGLLVLRDSHIRHYNLDPDSSTIQRGNGALTAGAVYGGFTPCFCRPANGLQLPPDAVFREFIFLYELTLVVQVFFFPSPDPSPQKWSNVFNLTSMCFFFAN